MGSIVGIINMSDLFEGSTFKLQVLCLKMNCVPEPAIFFATAYCFANALVKLVLITCHSTA